VGRHRGDSRGARAERHSGGGRVDPATGDVADPTAGEATLLRALAASPGATSTGWAAESGVSSSRMRQLLGSLREKCGAPTTAALVALARDGPGVRDG